MAYAAFTIPRRHPRQYEAYSPRARPDACRSADLPRRRHVGGRWTIIAPTSSGSGESFRDARTARSLARGRLRFHRPPVETTFEIVTETSASSEQD